MPRPIQDEFPKARKKTICAIGDSLTFNQIYAPMMHEFYPEKLAELLRDAGCDVKSRNYGDSGETTAQMLQRIRCVTQSYDPAQESETPDLAIIWGGTNDDSHSYTATTLTRSGTTATFTSSTAHGLATGDVVTISGSNLSAYNVANAVITKVDATIFTYVMASDPGASSAGTPRFDHQTQANLEAMIIALRNGVSGMVGTQTALPAGLPDGTRYIVRYDTSTTGGMAGTAPATLASTHSGAQIWVSRNGVAGVSGWSRITPDNVGIERIIVMSQHWLHFIAGNGDMLDEPHELYASIRALQEAAADAQADDDGSVTFFDLYAYQRALIVAGYEGELTGTWAATDNDVHPSVHAGVTWAKGLLAHIQDREGWIDDLT